MLHFLPGPIQGVVISLLFTVNLLFWAIPVYAVILFKLIPVRPWQGLCTDALHWLCKCWQAMNTVLSENLQKRTWHIHRGTALSPQGKFVVISNHQTWNDIYVMMRVLGPDVPFFKFFIKQELIWVPVLGLVWWALDYPFMKRYSKAELRKNPALAGKDLVTARKSCEKYRRQPVTVLNYVEGTRFTPAKHDVQGSPYT
ncbi:MAG: acetyltransferase, partial [Oceanococcaceae bacterium]